MTSVEEEGVGTFWDYIGRPVTTADIARQKGLRDMNESLRAGYIEENTDLWKWVESAQCVMRQAYYDPSVRGFVIDQRALVLPREAKIFREWLKENVHDPTKREQHKETDDD